MKFLVCLFALLVCDGFAANINFITSTEEDCVRYGQGVKEGIICDEAMKQPFSSIMNNVGEMTHDGAVTAIKNIVLAGYYVPMERTDFQYLYNKALIKVCKGITTNRDDVNWQILQALYSTQFTSEQKLNEQVRQEVVEEIICRIQNSLVNLDANKINFKRNIFKCLSNDNRFSAFVPVVW